MEQEKRNAIRRIADKYPFLWSKVTSLEYAIDLKQQGKDIGQIEYLVAREYRRLQHTNLKRAV